MRRILVETAWCHDLPVRYYLLAETREDESEVYGIGVEYAGEVVEIPNITPYQRYIQELEEKLIQGLVTPATLRDVTEDWLLT